MLDCGALLLHCGWKMFIGAGCPCCDDGMHGIESVNLKEVYWMKSI